MTLPVAVISFNRPDYLAETLASLQAQTAEPFPVALFQDGPRKASDWPLIVKCVHEFSVRFPHSAAFVSRSNLGPGLNIDRAERWLFEFMRGDEAGVILEDDLALSPHYLATLEAMLAATQDDKRIAYVAAYGPILKIPPTPINAYAPLRQHWGCALTRRQWLKRKPLVDQYLNLLRGRDYRDRDIVAIMALRCEWGLPGPYTTQDVMRAAATKTVGGLRLNTSVHLARYIGRRGLHIDQRVYDAVGFANWPLHEGPLTGFGPVDEATACWCGETADEFIGTGSVAA